MTTVVKLYTNLPEDRLFRGIDKAIAENRLVEIAYRRPAGNTATITRRKVKPSHIIVYEDGTYAFRGYCTLRKAARTFRMDRFLAMGITDPLPRKQALVMYPTTWELRHACTQIVKNIEKWATRSWSTRPAIIRQPTNEAA
jgi:predicted DNA-binding transcriptional regulator YafY